MKNTLQRIYGYIQTHRQTDYIVLTLGLALFAALGLWHISASSIWFDEAFSVYLAQFNLWDIVKFTAADVHPPLYYWALSGWQSLFGQSELAVRSLSLVFAGIAIVFAYLLTRRWFGRRAAIISLLLLVLSPMLLRYGQEARMYTMAAAIVLAATYVLGLASESKRRGLWIVYGVLVLAGLWTHYFTALAWAAHWLWRVVVTWRTGRRGRQYLRGFFSTNWLIAYGIAVVLYAPWVPVILKQFTVVQSGFWIGPVTADSPLNYLTNLLFYQEHWVVKTWWVLLLIAVLMVTVASSIKAYRALSRKGRDRYLLIVSLAVVPVLLLLAMTLPGSDSSYFVERYLVPSLVATSPLIGVGLAVGLRRLRPHWSVLAVLLVVGAMIYGIGNVYYYGNYNKNSNAHILTREVIELIDERAAPGQPIIADSPWIFYEAVFYSSAEHPVYFIDANTQYIYGSLEMLKQSDQHKIKDLAAFQAEHPVIWYIGNTTQTDVPAYQPGWQKLQTVVAPDSIDGKAIYRATEYRIDV